MIDTTYEIPEKIDSKESDYLYTGISNITNAGLGLFTAIPIYTNEIIALFRGEILTTKEAITRAVQKEDGYFINLLDGTIMDSKHTHCFAKYANDAEAFVVIKGKNNSKITINETHEVCIVAVRDIKVGEEILTGYGKKYWKHFTSKQ